jgi:group I intron endonuclease
MYRVYLITNLINDKVYVGLTKHTIWQRWSTHQVKAEYGRQGYFYNALRKYGAWDFRIQQLAEVGTLKQAENLERVWIALFQSADRQYGYNSTFGGDGARHNEHTREKLRKLVEGKNPWKRFNNPEEAKQKLSVSLSGKPKTEEHRKNLSEARKNLSPEARKNISAARIGKKHTEASRLKMSLSRKGEGNARFLHDVEDEEIINLYLNGVSGKRIAKQLGVSEHLVWDRLKRNNIQTRPLGTNQTFLLIKK